MTCTFCVVGRRFDVLVFVNKLIQEGGKFLVELLNDVVQHQVHHAVDVAVVHLDLCLNRGRCRRRRRLLIVLNGVVGDVLDRAVGKNQS